MEALVGPNTLTWITVVTLSLSAILLVAAQVVMVELLLSKGVPDVKKRAGFTGYITAKLVLSSVAAGLALASTQFFFAALVWVVAGAIIVHAVFSLSRVMLSCEVKLETAVQEANDVKKQLRESQEEVKRLEARKLADVHHISEKVA